VAYEIAQLWWIMFTGACVVFALVFGLALYAFFARRPPAPSPNWFVPGFGILFPLVVLAPLTLYAFFVGERIVRSDRPPDLSVEVVAQRWWWEIRYPDARGSAPTVTANEIHIPAGRQIELKVSTRDVIHSVWIPNLAGKIDAIPGRANRMRFEADRPGVFRGQCAEFCGAQHARMAFYVVAHSPETFDEWLEAQRRPASPPDDPVRERGLRIFMANECADCHTIRGTAARGKKGPDLTHVGSRRSLAAATLPNNRASLVNWIRASQSVKPANAMPNYDELADDELGALAAYLEGLK
jgi:cytochrome c oxidase subunit II